MQKNNENKILQNSVTSETKPEPKKTDEIELNTSPFCQKNCKVCNSMHRQEIFRLLKSGEKYRNISKHLELNYNEKISIASISRHKQNYNKALRSLIQKVELEKFDHTAETVAKHQKQVLFLMKVSFEQIINHLTAGTLVLSIDEYEKLTKLYYNILRDPDSADDEDVLAIFQKAAGKRGFDINQGVLFKPKKVKAE